MAWSDPSLWQWCPNDGGQNQGSNTDALGFEVHQCICTFAMVFVYFDLFGLQLH